MNNTGLFHKHPAARPHASRRRALAACLLALALCAPAVNSPAAEDGMPPAAVPPSGMRNDPSARSGGGAGLEGTDLTVQPLAPAKRQDPAATSPGPDASGQQGQADAPVTDLPPAPGMEAPLPGTDLLEPDLLAPETDEPAAPAAPPAKAAPPPRRDTIFGTMDEGLRMGTDPGSGDSIMRVEPMPQKEQQHEMPPVEIRPQIEYPSGSE